MSTTVMPFLYRTRTLSNFNWRRPNSTAIPLYKSKTFRNNLNSSTRSQQYVHHRTISATTSTSPRNVAGGVRIRRTTGFSDVGPSLADGRELDTAKTTFYKASSKQENETSSRKYQSATTLQENLDDFTFPTTVDLEDDTHQDDLGSDKGKAQDFKRAQYKEESTITSSERRAFQRIFADIFERTQRSSSRVDEVLIESSVKPKTPIELQNAKSKLDGVLADALWKPVLSQKRLEAAVNKYPPALQAAAAKALGLHNEEEVEDILPNQDAAWEQLEILRAPERLRVENLMKSAPTDFQLWEVMEKEVFSLIARLGLEDVTQAVEIGTETTAKMKTKLKPRKTNELQNLPGRQQGGGAEIQEEEQEKDAKLKYNFMELESGKLALTLHGPLYPSYLLFGLRLFDRSFAKPSPMALSILPKIKSLGLISHVLGASTKFYNELLYIYHFRHNNYRGMISLLDEMEQAALDFDEETLNIVLDAMVSQKSVRNGEMGEALQRLSFMPEFSVYQKFKDWRRKVSYMVGEKRHSEEY